MSTGSETVTVPLQFTPSSPSSNFFSRLNFSIDARNIRRTQSLRVKSANTVDNMITQRHSQDSGSQQQQGAASGSTIARSMSRYRRRPGSVTVKVDATQKINSDPPHPWEAPKAPPVPTMPTIPAQLKTASMTQKEDDAPAAEPNSPPRPQPRRNENTRSLTVRRSMADHYHQSRPSTAKSTKSSKSEESAWRRLASRDGRRNRLNSEDDNEAAKREIARLEAENHRLLVEQKKKDLERLETHLANNSRAPAQSQPLKPKSPVIEKFVFLTKGRRNKDGLSPGLSPTPSSISVVPTKAFIEPGGRGVVPQTDAPHSAINAGDRNVAVRYKQHTLSLEVTPETTPDDIITQTSELMGSDEINPASCVVIETYGVLGLERRLRRYESIRDIMNSWDRDTQNQLVVKVSGSEEENWELDIDSVPGRNDPPQGFQLYMYHSNRPGKWNKRWITLLETGQVLCAKKPNANSTDKDTVSLCHLSDYDIYTPTESQMRRHIKPPKRYCFVVKSQQKTTVFMNTENYVHYFSTDDPKIAAQFREKVQGWRSWYLVDRRPKAPKISRNISIKKIDDKPPQITLPALSHPPKKVANVASMNGHRLRVSVDEGPYSIGQFEPLLDMKRFDKRLSQFGQDFLPPVPDVSTMPKEIPAHHLNSTAKHGKDDRRERKLIDSIHSTINDGFTGNGLLGEGYEERRQAAETGKPDRGRQRSRDDGFTEGPSLLNGKSEPDTHGHGHNPDSSSWFPSALEHSARKRSTGPSSARPSTSAGVMHTHHHGHSHTRRPSFTSSSRPPPPLNGKPLLHDHPNPLASQPTGLSHSNRRDRPKPLVNLESTFQEPPQWAKGKQGHGVKAPEGMTHLVDLITVPNSSKPNGSNELEVPPRSALRRPPNTAPLPGLARTRSKTQGAPPPRTLEKDVPPVPSLPGHIGSREPLRSNPLPRSRERERGRDREREHSAYSSVSGRAGTLKVV
ncbi:hypothetical protein F4804DRAFT_310634 [Jackrogersella minutella]|nr:hypothetical protein F4804DRAFT_310634 [Jackrogersella minutella]